VTAFFTNSTNSESVMEQLTGAIMRTADQTRSLADAEKPRDAANSLLDISSVHIEYMQTDTRRYKLYRHTCILCERKRATCRTDTTCIALYPPTDTSCRPSRNVFDSAYM